MNKYENADGIVDADDADAGSERPEPAPRPSSAPGKLGIKGRGRNPNSLRNLEKGRPGPGRSVGSRNTFSRENIVRLAAQFANDVSSDWDRHGAEFVEAMRLRFPQVYASMVTLVKNETAKDNTGPIVVTWMRSPPEDAPAPPAPEPIKLLPAPSSPKYPDDLSESDWALMLDVLALVKQTLPAGSTRPPSEIMGVIKQALTDHLDPHKPVKTTKRKRSV